MGRARLAASDLTSERIDELLDSGMSVREIANEAGISTVAVYKRHRPKLVNPEGKGITYHCVKCDGDFISYARHRLPDRCGLCGDHFWRAPDAAPAPKPKRRKRR